MPDYQKVSPKDAQLDLGREDFGTQKLGLRRLIEVVGLTVVVGLGGCAHRTERRFLGTDTTNQVPVTAPGVVGNPLPVGPSAPVISSGSARAEFNRLTRLDSFQKLPDATKISIFTLTDELERKFKNRPLEFYSAARELRELVQSKGFSALGDDDQLSVLSIFGVTTGFNNYLNRLVNDPETPLLRTATDGKSALAHVRSLVPSKGGPATLHADFISANVEVGDVANQILEMVYTKSIFQSTRATCGCSAGAILAQVLQPAEVVRIAAGLFSRRGAVQLYGGEMVTLSSDWSNPAADDNRNLLMRVLQAALADYAAGPETGHFSSKENAFVDKEGKVVHAGLKHEEAKRLLEGMSGVGHQVLVREDKPGQSGGPELLARIMLETGLGRPVYAALFWDDAPDTHAVVILKMDGERIYFRNSHDGAAAGAGLTGKVGLMLENPKRRIESIHPYIESMTLTEAERQIAAIVVRKKADSKVK